MFPPYIAAVVQCYEIKKGFPWYYFLIINYSSHKGFSEDSFLPSDV